MSVRKLVDYHVHTDFSGDSQARPQDVLARAAALGLKEICITDHLDYDYADVRFEAIDFEEYFRVLQEQARATAPELQVLTGVEIGYQSHLPERMSALIKAYPFDFVICSTHMAEGRDFFTGDFFKGKSKQEAYGAYLASVLEATHNFADFDVYGHLDVITRYGVYEDNSLHYPEYVELIEAILRSLIERGKGIELNTSGLRYGQGDFHPQLEIIRRYKQLGGEIITVGSDAHREKDLAADFAQAYAVLKEVGFNRIAHYRQRRLNFIDIG